MDPGRRMPDGIRRRLQYYEYLRMQRMHSVHEPVTAASSDDARPCFMFVYRLQLLIVSLKLLCIPASHLISAVIAPYYCHWSSPSIRSAAQATIEGRTALKARAGRLDQAHFQATPP